MKKISLSFLFIALVAFFSSCEKVVGDGPVVQQIIPVSGFSKLSVSVQSRVNYSIGPDYRVEVMAQQNIIDILRFEKSGEELTIKLKPGVWIKKNEEIIVNITAPDLKAVNLSGSGNVLVSGPLAGTSLDLKVSGSGNLEVQQATLTDQLIGNVSGSGSITVFTGSTLNENLKISGSGNIQLTGVQASKATTDISGSGNIKVKVSQTLDAHISGSGSVYYLGSPLVSSHVSGSGGVRQL